MFFVTQPTALLFTATACVKFVLVHLLVAGTLQHRSTTAKANCAQ